MTTPLDIDAALLTTKDLPAIRVILATRILAALTGVTYPATVLADNPLLYWRFGESSGWTAFDASPNNFNATYGDGSTGATKPTLGVAGLLTGDIDTAITLTGVSQSVSSNDLFTSLGANLPNSSWEFWVKSTDTTSTGGTFLAVAGSASAAEVDWNPSTDVVSVGLFDGVTGDVEGTVSANLNDGNPHHVVIRVDSTTTFSVWVDGVSKTVAYSSQVALAAPATPTSNLSIPSPVSTFTLDEYAVYDHRLPDATIAAHYTAGTTRSTPTVDTLATSASAITTLQEQITDAKSLIDSLAQIAP